MPHNCHSHDRAHKRYYKTFNYPDFQTGDKTLLTGIRGVTDSEKVYISGFYVPSVQADTTSFVYKGCACGHGKFYDLNYPKVDDVATITNLYGPNNGAVENTINVVGNYTIENVNGTFGCLYQGPLDNTGTWTTIVPTPLSPYDKIINTICHSNMGDLVVGNYDTLLIQGKAFIYDMITEKYYNIISADSISITAYGVWHNGGHSYTICGGYTTNTLTNVAYIADWNNETHELSNWQIYQFDNDPVKASITHFDGITKGCGDGKYNLTGDYLKVNGTEEIAFFAKVKRNEDETFDPIAKWSVVAYPDEDVTSGNSVYKDVVIGVYSSVGDDSVNGYLSNLKKY
jgi:hypothetical protein